MSGGFAHFGPERHYRISDCWSDVANSSQISINGNLPHNYITAIRLSGVPNEFGDATFARSLFSRPAGYPVSGVDSPSRIQPGGHARLTAQCFHRVMANNSDQRVVTASRDIAASAAGLFELIADPSQQPRWDGNDNLTDAPADQRARKVGDVFTMTLTTGASRENHVVEFERARITTADKLQASLDRLAALAESAGD